MTTPAIWPLPTHVNAVVSGLAALGRYTDAADIAAAEFFEGYFRSVDEVLGVTR